MKKINVLLGSLIPLILAGCGGSGNTGAPTTAATASPSAASPNAPFAPTATFAGVEAGRPIWMNPELSPTARAETLLLAMTLPQKLNQLFNFPDINEELQDENPPCERQDIGRRVEGIPELFIPNMRFANGGTGIRGGDCNPEPTSTALPSGVAAAATFDPEINFQWGQVLGAELRAWAHQALWGPGLNIIRTPYGGRNHEYMSEDPYLTGVTATQQVLGIQSNGKTHATIKHFAGNESEYRRERWTAGSRIPSRAMHEIYLLPFEMTVRDARPAAIMCAFPQVNFLWTCESEALLKQTLRGRWGFDGYLVSDRRAMHSTVRSIRAGTSFELDFDPQFYRPDVVRNALDAGFITEADIDALLRPRYVKMFAFGHFDEAYDRFLPKDLSANATIGRRAAEGSIVLLKNDGLLPLQSTVRSVALIGADWFAGRATMPPRGSDQDDVRNVISPYTISPKEGLERTLKRLGSNATVTFNNGDLTAEAVALAQASDVVILMVGDNPRETWDLATLTLPAVRGTNQELLIPRVLAANPNTVVVLKTQGMLLMPWLPQARALIEAWYPGQDDGDVVADVLFGVTNPSGKLPVTFGNTANEAAYETESQYPGDRENNGLGGGMNGFAPNGSAQLVSKYTENLAVGYRWYEQRNVQPLFAFGHGLSYTTFAYSNLNLRTTNTAAGNTILTVEYTITNTGARSGKEASQVYLTLPPVAAEPGKRLVGFKKVELLAGESKPVSINIECTQSNHPFSYFLPNNDADLERWADGNWITPSGAFTVHVGTSSAQIALAAPVNLDLTRCNI